MTPRETAEKLNLSYDAVLYHIKTTRLLKATKNGNGRWQVDPDSVAAWQPQQPVPGKRGPYPGAGRKSNPDTLPPNEQGKRHIYLGPDISLEDMKRIRRALPKAGLRARILLRLAELAENDPESFKRALADLGVGL
jgi:hypothetical protein